MTRYFKVYLCVLVRTTLVRSSIVHSCSGMNNPMCASHVIPEIRHSATVVIKLKF